MFKNFNYRDSPWLSLFTLVGFILMGTFLGQLLVTLLLGSPAQIIQGLKLDIASYKNSALIMQAILAAHVFIIAPLLHRLLIEARPIKVLFQLKQSYGRMLMLTLGLVSSFIIVNTIFIQWNMHLQLPRFLEVFEQWAQAKETELKLLTDLLMTSHSITELLLTMVVLALIPAIGEELLFRGILQNIFYDITQNKHWAIGISAFIFSAIHLQFYGFMPRFLLGLVFGYIYSWTHDLSLAMFAHFFNNAFTLILVFLQQRAWIVYDLKNIQPPSWWVILLFSLSSITFAHALQRLGKARFKSVS